MKFMYESNIIDLEGYVDLVLNIKSLLPRHSIILMSGVVGAGKTTFVSYFCESFQIKVTQSPTYAIHHRYGKMGLLIDHFDLYRVSSEEEIDASGFFDLLNDKSDYKFIEWSENLSREYLIGIELLYELNIDIKSDNSRTFILNKIS